MRIKELSPQYLVNTTGKKEFVVLTIKEYEELIEDLQDLAVMAERKDEPHKDFGVFKDNLKKNGLI